MHVLAALGKHAANHIVESFGNSHYPDWPDTLCLDGQLHVFEPTVIVNPYQISN
jgi:hypothetical protein